jgi:NitT/TauT family transport system permease protein
MTKDKRKQKIKTKELPVARQLYLKKIRREKIKVAVLQAVILVAFLGLWQLLASTGVIDDFITSSPLRIAKMMTQLLSQDIFKHIGITLFECIIGFVLSGAIGFAIAVGLWASETARRVLEPYIVTLNSLPKIALGPIIIVWMGAGIKAIVTMTVLICVIVTVISVLAGFLACDDGKILLMKSMGASKIQIFFKLVLPNSLPNLISVLKINVGLAWVGTIMGEYLVSGAGLGYLIIYGGQVFKLDLVMTSTVILCVLAALMYLGVALIEKKVASKR